MDQEFSAELIDELVKVAKAALPLPIRPATADDGRAFYLMFSDRERMIRNLQPEWTYKAVTITRADGSLFVGYEPVQIETLTGSPFGQTVYFEDGYIG